MIGRVFRASGLEGDVAVKFTVRDSRDRAGREWAALTLLAENSDTLAPRPLLLDRDRYPHQVIVQSWLDGNSSDSPPADDAAWESLCRHLLEIHSLPKGPGPSRHSSRCPLRNLGFPTPCGPSATSTAACRQPGGPGP